jgi:S-adenosyl-L-methionine hydrolase (adenosine-forming)
MKGAILARNPDARLVDLTHEVPAQDIRRAAFMLATSVAHFPAGSIFLVVVDPGVGTERRPLAVRAAEWLFVGPDNGVLAWTLRFLRRDGLIGLEDAAGRLRLRQKGHAVELTEPRFGRPEVSSTFHGRDLFGPVAAELSLGRQLPQLGRPLDALVDLPWPDLRRAADGSLYGVVVTHDHYGNLITNLRRADLPHRPVFEIGEHRVPGLSPHFQSDAPLVALLGSSGFVEIAAPNGSAASLLRVEAGASIAVRPG